MPHLKSYYKVKNSCYTPVDEGLTPFQCRESYRHSVSASYPRTGTQFLSLTLIMFIQPTAADEHTLLVVPRALNFTSPIERDERREIGRVMWHSVKNNMRWKSPEQHALVLG